MYLGEDLLQRQNRIVLPQLLLVSNETVALVVLQLSYSHVD